MHRPNNFSIKQSKTKLVAKGDGDWIRPTPIQTRNIYRFGAAKNSVVLAGRTSHTIKKVERQNKKPKKLNAYILLSIWGQ